MGALSRLVKKCVSTFTGYDIARFGQTSVVIVDKRQCDIERLRDRFGEVSLALIDKKRRADAWFSYSGQVRNLIENNKIDLVIDVGANDGSFARTIREVYSGQILSFEPIADVFTRLAKCASGDPAWQVYNFALGSEESMQTINISTETVFSSLLKTNEYCAQKFGDLALSMRQEVVSVRRLDNVLREIGPNFENANILLKMDTQGYDLEVFKGLGEIISNVVIMQSEISLIPIYDDMPHWTESIGIFEKSGFCVAGLFPVSRDADSVIEYDCLLARKAVPLGLGA